MECPACLGTCAGSCKICKGACGSGAAAPGLSGEPKVCLTKPQFVKEHKQLIKLLKKAGEEGEDQEKELNDVLKGQGHPQAPKGMKLPGLFRWHLEMGHPLDALIESEDDKKVVFNLHWSPSKAVVNKLNKEFLTWRFSTDGRLEAQRGDDFEKDAEKMIASLEGSEKN